MKGIIFFTKKEANDANEQLNALDEKSIRFIGSGQFIEPPSKPFTDVIKHPDLDNWALISNPEIESFLQKKAIELTSDWFEEIK